MVSANTLCKKLLNVKHSVIEDANFYLDQDGVSHLRIRARTDKWHQDDCPFCHRRCPRYDQRIEHPRTWRSLDFGATLVEVEGWTHRIECPQHGVVTAYVPWAYPGSGFTRDFDLPVGRCVNRTLNDIEPERSRRLDNLVNIGIDETSYKKGHKYITVIVNHDTNTVVWAAQGHGKKVLEQFYRQLTPKQLSSIRVVTGDGARWITDCVNEFTPECERCIDPFHVVEWAMEALDEVRREAWREAHAKAVQAEKANPRGRGRPKADDPEAQSIADAKAKAEQIKKSTFTLGKAPEHLTENQKLKLAMIAENDKRLYRAYSMKEHLRLLLKLKDTEEAETELKRWLWRSSHSRIAAFKELYKKIKRHKNHILNTIRLGMSNARIEATNNKIKLIIRKAYGFRNIQNMLDMVCLVCSNLRVQLPNRKMKLVRSA